MSILKRKRGHRDKVGAGIWEVRSRTVTTDRIFEKSYLLPKIFRSPLTPLKKGGIRVKVPQLIGGFRGI